MGRSERGCAEVCGQCGCKGRGGNKEGPGALKRMWMRCADGVGSRSKVEKGREKVRWASASVVVRTLWVQGENKLGGEKACLL